MRDRRMDKFSVLPFSVGCISQSSVIVTESQAKRAQAKAAATTGSSPPSCGASPKLASGKPRISISESFQKLIKSLSRLFVIYKEEDEEIEMEIGFPTDVQHVGHIGWDGFNSMNAMKSWDKTPEFLQLPSFSLKQFMAAAQVGSAQRPIGDVPTRRRGTVDLISGSLHRY